MWRARLRQRREEGERGCVSAPRQAAPGADATGLAKTSPPGADATGPASSLQCSAPAVTFLARFFLAGANLRPRRPVQEGTGTLRLRFFPTRCNLVQTSRIQDVEVCGKKFVTAEPLRRTSIQGFHEVANLQSC